MSSSELSELSSELSTADDIPIESFLKNDLNRNPEPVSSAKKSTSSQAKKKRPVSPPHEYVLADNPDIAVICMFRSRFSDAFPKSLPQFGPQDIEQGVSESILGEIAEKILCALLGLVMNRKKDVERGHFQRALEEAIQTHTSQWPSKWAGRNPLHGGRSFINMNAEERLTLLKTLALWSLGSSEAIQTILKESYKQQRRDDDLNQPLSVQPWGRDGDKRRYWLIEGHDDTCFRLYRESNPMLKQHIWRSVAGSIDELKEVASRLGEEGSQAARRLRDSIMQGIPRLEASEEKRKRREYRNARKAQFVRPEPGFSLYEGRTRGKRIKYTFSDEEEGASDAPSTRRSNRQSGLSSPAELNKPIFTNSGRQIRSRSGNAAGDSVVTGQPRIPELPTNGASDSIMDVGEESRVAGRTRQSDLRHALPNESRPRKHIEGYNVLDEMEYESDASSTEEDWDGVDDDDIDGNIADDDDEEDDDDTSSEERSIGSGEREVDAKIKDQHNSLIVALRYQKAGLNLSRNDTTLNGATFNKAPHESPAAQLPDNSLPRSAAIPELDTINNN